MISAILIANRGEIACRITRTAKRLGLRTVAVYSDADADALHVDRADEAYHIGRAEPKHSYLSADAILEAAALSGVEAIHPGYGFLAENADFARACRDAGFIFIGPPPEAIEAMGSKSQAKLIMEANGVPVVPGYHGDAQDLAALSAAADIIGYPLLIKAVAGGGGKGMRIVETRRELAPRLEQARREAGGAFGDDRVILEKYLERPRHIEVQVFGDSHGEVIALSERDCSLQRRHQKIIEEAPAPGLDPGLRHGLADAAVRAAKAVHYEGAGTIEFLLSSTGEFYFLEMNTRLQVEHPVTEMITGLDLVEWQIRVAAGEPLPLSSDDIVVRGHAFEARIYAEDPSRDFLPATGTLRHLRLPTESLHVRIDTGVRAGDTVGIHYDPLIAKLIVWDADRIRALTRIRRALELTEIVGLANNVGFLAAVAGHPAFIAANLDTGFIDHHRHDLFPETMTVSDRLLTLACLAELQRRDREAREQARRSTDPYSPWHQTSGWRLNDDNHHVLTFLDGEQSVSVTVHYRTKGFILDIPGSEHPITVSGETDEQGDLIAVIDGVRIKATVIRHGEELTVIAGGRFHRLTLDDPAARAEWVEAITGSLKAPMPGKIVAIHAQAGDRVDRGATLMVLEAMKMEHVIQAPAEGVVARIHFSLGEQVEEGATLVSFDVPDEEAGQPAAT